MSLPLSGGFGIEMWNISRRPGARAGNTAGNIRWLDGAVATGRHGASPFPLSNGSHEASGGAGERATAQPLYAGLALTPVSRRRSIGRGAPWPEGAIQGRGG
jgi:hypothetical protein